MEKPDYPEQMEVPNPKEGWQTEDWIIGQTEVLSFGESELITSQEVAAYLRETIPPSHLNGCDLIEYEPENPHFWDSFYSLFTLAFFNTETREIKIGPEQRFEDAQDMLDTVTHEVGHNQHQNLIETRPDIANRWESINKSCGQDEFVSDYAHTNQFEDFAESYKTYIRDPELLQFVSNEKYEFMRDYVFNGREYNNSA